ncbi:MULTISPECIES: STAS domain-containing protein [unclassified Streptomyces]|uniref:STAS domain-containing protein n=1 Tax=unclassified Streptomyces TaxID=2593676 RepID=UPI0029B3D608|nr:MULTISPECIES: STAS domain-containing protein [unclassified Streptomyces]MDX3747507.1 STAS domain-containing protein [Streptomyces sp. AK08-02]
MPWEHSSSAQQIHVYETEERTVVQLRGEIDIAVVLRVTATVDTATGRPSTDVVIDLSPVEFLDCSGLGLLCRARRRVEERGGHLTLVCPQPHIRKMIRIVDLSQVFVLTDTLDEALNGRTSVS